MHPSPQVDPKILQLLQQKFAFSQFRPGQWEILSYLLEGRSVLGLMPTGSGKSLTYQLYSQLKADLVLVITPLIALMEDQAQKAKGFGISASFIHSQLSADEKKKRQLELSQGRYQLFLATPERLQKPEFREALKSRKIGLFVVDEAHCISLWGHDFRPDYAKLGEIRRSLGQPLTLALTATATPDIQTEIRKSLGLETDPLVTTGLQRPNLSLNVQESYGLEQKIEAVIPHLEKEKGTYLIYTTLIRTAEEIRRDLDRKGIKTLIYHGDLAPGQRRNALKNFMKTEEVVMVATPAFGLGIDKPNIRGVFHFEPPSSLESYFQEVGRAGRDGKPSAALLFYDEEDLTIPMQFIKSAYPERAYLERMYELIRSSPNKALSEGREWLAEQMSFKNRGDHRVDSALNILQRWGCLEQNSQGGIVLTGELNPEMFQVENQQALLKHHHQKLYAFLQWIKNKEECRLIQIYNYFGHKETKRCGLCDNCQGE